MTLLAGSLQADTFDEALRRCQAALAEGAQMIELRLDLMPDLSDDEVRALCQRIPNDVSVIFTIRSAAEGGDWTAGDDERISRLIELGPWADFLDVELVTWQRSANIRQKIGLALRRASHESAAHHPDVPTRRGPRRLILSTHDTKGRPPTLQTDLLAMLTADVEAIPKLAWRARSIRDNFEALELVANAPRPIVAICMGGDGLLSRVLARKFGAFATFAAVGPTCETAPGQPTLGDLKRRYRWDRISPHTKVYGVVGDPLDHSLSPRLHNVVFEQLGLDAVFVPLPVRAGYDSFKAFMHQALAWQRLDLAGLAITLPHKANALRFLCEQDGGLDPLSLGIGAINTLWLDEARRLHGANTDAPAAMQTLRDELNLGVVRGLRVVVLGAGGAARAIVAALCREGADVTVYNRADEGARRLAVEFGCRAADWSLRHRLDAELIINCTPIGMWPDVQAVPIDAARLPPQSAVFDVVYHPAPTAWVVQSRRAGHRAVGGLAMFLRQAAMQLKCWTGASPPIDALRRALADPAASGAGQPGGEAAD